MNKRLGTLAAAVALSAVATISSGASQPIPPVPRPCTTDGTSNKGCTPPRQLPPVSSALKGRPGSTSLSAR